MNRHEQHKQKRLQNPEMVEGYREMTAEFRLIQAIDEIRIARYISEESSRIAIEPIRQPEFDLESLVAGITSQNLYKEVDFGGPIGHEVW